MRALRTVAPLAALAPLVFASAAGTETLPRLPARLPAPITLQTSRASYEIERDGRVVRVAPRVLPFPRDAAWFPGTGAWFAIRHGKLVIGRWGRTLWRSHGPFPLRLQFGVVTVGAGRVAFSYRSDGSEQLYMARVGDHRERRIARGEFPLGWTAGGLFTYRYRGPALVLRSDTGGLERIVAGHVPAYAFDSANGTLYFIAHRQLYSALGAASRAIASLAALGMSGRPAVGLMVAGGLVELVDQGRLVLLRPDGALFAEMRLRDSITSPIAAASGETAVAFTVLHGPPTGGIETVEMLRAGAHAAIVLYRQRIGNACERSAGVQWHGQWLLYSTSDATLTVLDSTMRHRPIELTRLIAKLTAQQNGVSAYWSGQPPAL